MAQFSVRAWLAEQIGCSPDSLTILDATPDQRTILFAIDGEARGQIHVLESDDRDDRGIVAAWAPDGSANAEIPGEAQIAW